MPNTWRGGLLWMIQEGKMKAYRIKERKKDEAEHPNPSFGEQACVTGC